MDILHGGSAISKAANQILELGWAPIPLRPGDKVPKVKHWAKWKNPPTESTVGKWFSGDCGLGVVLGHVSGGLACRDFDVTESFHDWAESHPRLAESLPRTRTARGFHVFFHADESDVRAASLSGSATIHGGDGELKFNGFAVLPPSIHKTGVTYTWENPPDDVPFVSDLHSAGLIPKPANPEMCISNTPAFFPPGDGVQSFLTGSDPRGLGADEHFQFIKEGKLWDRIQKAIVSTLPEKIGQRNARIFDFARNLRSIPELRTATEDELRGLACSWFCTAYPTIATKNFATTWWDFRVAWDRVKYPAGAYIAHLFEQTQGEKRDRLAQLCELLQQNSGGEPFHLDNRTAGRLLGVHRNTANNWLKDLCKSGVLTLAEKHEYKAGGKGRSQKFFFNSRASDALARTVCPGVSG